MKNKVSSLFLCTIILAVLLRLVSVLYGLPMYLVADEPSGIFGAMKMLETRNLFPFLDIESFNSVLYYPPYMSYFFIGPFGLVGLFDYLSSGLSLETISNLWIVDMSLFFIVARVVAIFFSILTIFLLYPISKRLFGLDKYWALLPGFLLSTSIIHIAFSGVARHWTFVTFFFVLSWYFLFSDSKRKYTWSLFSAGLGIGVSSISVVWGVFVGLYWLLKEKDNYRKNLKDFFVGTVIFVGLVAIPNILYPQSQGFLADVSFYQGKDLISLILSPINFLWGDGRVDLFMLVFGVLGLFWLAREKHIFGYIGLVFVYLYSSLFYLLFHFETRFLTPLMPIFALSSGYLLFHFWNKRKVLVRVLVISCLICSIIVSARFSYLVFSNDNRSLVDDWIINNVSDKEFIVTDGDLFRLPTDGEFFSRINEYDSSLLRKNDYSEKYLVDNMVNYGKYFKVLNLYTFDEKKDNLFVERLIGQYDSGYAIFDEKSVWFDLLSDYWSDYKVIHTIKGLDDNWSFTGGRLRGFPWELWHFNNFGPTINIYEFRI